MYNFAMIFKAAVGITLSCSLVCESKTCEGVTSPKYLMTYSGNISSPRYPSKHPKNQHCEWILTKFNYTKLVQITIYDAELAYGIFGPMHYLTMPDGEQFTSSHTNVCRVYGYNRSLQGCPQASQHIPSSCLYNMLRAGTTAKVMFDSGMYFKKRGFALGYRIFNCQSLSEPDIQSSTTEEGVTTANLSLTGELDFNHKVYIIVPSTLAILVFIVCFIVVVKIVILSRKPRKERTYTMASEANVYEAAVITYDNNHTYDSIGSRPGINRNDHASYLSHSELERYPPGGAQAYQNIPSSSAAKRAKPQPLGPQFIDHAYQDITGSSNNRGIGGIPLSETDDYVEMSGSSTSPIFRNSSEDLNTPYMTMK